MDQSSIIKYKNPTGWLRGLGYDSIFIVGIACLALGSGIISVLQPQWFTFILFLDLWFLGYHHVIATFTRLSFDTESFKEHKFLVIWLPIIVAITSMGIFYLIGPWVLATTYLYWQWFHYTRQSYGISRVYHCKFDTQKHKLDQLIIYLLPLAGIAYRSYQDPGMFLGMPLKVIPVSLEVFQAILIASSIVLIWWLIRQWITFKNGKTSVAYVTYMLSHIIIFIVGYLWIQDINKGWLVLNVWHNAQYIMFVWLYNNKRFKDQIDTNHRFLSFLSLTKNKFWYYGFCLALSTIIYAALEKVTSDLGSSTMSVVLVVYMTINFHHYIVDGLIWKVRKKPMRQTLDLKEG